MLFNLQEEIISNDSFSYSDFTVVLKPCINIVIGEVLFMNNIMCYLIIVNNSVHHNHYDEHCDINLYYNIPKDSIVAQVYPYNIIKLNKHLFNKL